ncbi:hypothetical protein A2T98_06325 [Nodularia spumigena CENA596]|uniref:Uncharacterized protein n=1 Tax=Nodularia spumigena CENA596 TaxID=1819295 RepID=A0A166K6Y4_NODSP|nr:hypothetical protein [Nodularia spumigena]KZL50662.1 hypothetical protein A2T98_06325 [Nodularia spumigena CENA596]
MLGKKFSSIFSCSLATVALMSGSFIAPIQSYASEGQKVAQSRKFWEGATYVLGVASNVGSVIDIAVHCSEGGRSAWSFNHHPNTPPETKSLTEQITDRGALNYLAYQTCSYGIQGAYSVCQSLGGCKNLKSYKVAICPSCPQIMYIQRIY